ncbi:MAG: PH domain-containing protein [Nanoarchaeota archaeon]|nr:PH domain-containing protein [Nanoarchaeota archaeon]
MKKEQILLKVWTSRKAYLFYYFLILLLIGVLGYFYFKGIELSTNLWIIAIVLILFLIKFIEIHRIRNWWAITDMALIESKGIVNKNIREIDFTSISDIDLDQWLYKRILGYGTINIRRFMNEASISVKNINNPERFLNIVQDAIRLNKVKK